MRSGAVYCFCFFVGILVCPQRDPRLWKTCHQLRARREKGGMKRMRQISRNKDSKKLRKANIQKIFWELIEPGVLDLRTISFKGFERSCRACLTGELIPWGKKERRM